VITDVAAFLAARYNEREEAVSESRTWTVEHHECRGWGPPCDRPCPSAAECLEGRCDHCVIIGSDGMRIYDEGGHDRTDADHIACYDPAWALADQDRKRKIVAEYEEAHANAWTGHGSPSTDDQAGFHDEILGRVLQVLAAEFADHPDYDAKWGPA
jgi:hypothetical protein